ncbi:protein of unknown function [Burkholderia multivorans]
MVGFMDGRSFAGGFIECRPRRRRRPRGRGKIDGRKKARSQGTGLIHIRRRHGGDSSNYTHRHAATQYYLCKKTSGRRFVASAMQQKHVASVTARLKGTDRAAFFDVSPVDPGESQRKIRGATMPADAYSRHRLH